jgi:hypothetical protein
MYLCPDMATRRIISFFIAATLLLSLVVPPVSGAHSCGEAARALVVSASASKTHGCVGCTRSKKGKNVASPSMRTVITTAAGISAEHAQAMLCCNEGREARSSTVDVPTLITPVTSVTAVLLGLAHLWLPGAAQAARVSVAAFKIGASPPFLAAALQHSYLRTSVFLI